MKYQRRLNSKRNKNLFVSSQKYNKNKIMKLLYNKISNLRTIIKKIFKIRILNI
jgi:hypothetical protein